MSCEDEYETLPEGTGPGVVLLAGAMAGIMEHCVMYPVDCVKTRMQALACEQGAKLPSTSILRNLASIVRQEGIFRPIAGVQAMGIGAGPAHALYFHCYETLKLKLTPYTMKSVVPESAVHGFAGATATLFHDAVMTPAEVVKQRMQMCCSPYKGAVHCARTVYTQEGLRAFYRSYPTALTMNIPFQATHFMVYEAVQEMTNPTKTYNPVAHAVSGAAAGALAAFITMPLDVCKTLLNTQEANVLTKLNTGKVVGLMSAFRVVWSLAGPAGLFKGCKERILYQMPATAISWSVYEFFKHTLSGKDNVKEKKIINSVEPETLSELRSSHGRGGGHEDGGSEGKFNWESVITDRQSGVVRAVTQSQSDLPFKLEHRSLLTEDIRTLQIDTVSQIRTKD